MESLHGCLISQIHYLVIDNIDCHFVRKAPKQSDQLFSRLFTPLEEQLWEVEQVLREQLDDEIAERPED